MWFELCIHVQITKTRSSTRNRVFGEKFLVKTRHYKWDIYWKKLSFILRLWDFEKHFPYKAFPFKTPSEKSLKKGMSKAPSSISVFSMYGAEICL